MRPFLFHHSAGGPAPWLALLALLAAVYWPGLSGGFIFDDYPNLVLDGSWRLDHLTPDAIRHVLQAGISSESGRPLAMMSFGLNYYSSGESLWALKATNVAMHAVAAVLAYQLALLLARLAHRDAPRSHRGFALACTAIWSLHPLQVSTVLYVVQRMEVGAAIGIFGAVASYLAARMRMADGRRGWPWFPLALAATAFGLGFKETALLVPAYTLLAELTLLRFSASTPGARRTLVGAYGLLCGAGALLYFAWIVPQALAPGAYASRDFSLVQRLLSQPGILIGYLGQILAPNPETYAFYYDGIPIPRGPWPSPGTLAALVALGALAATAVAVRRRNPLFAFGIGWFLLGHALTSNVIPLELAFEHRNYVPLFGIALAVCALVRPLLRMASRGTGGLLCVAACLCLSAATWTQAATWGAPLQLALTLESRAPQSARAAYSLGAALYALSGDDPTAPTWGMAQRQFERAAALSDSRILGDVGAITQLSRAGRPVPARNWQALRSKLARWPLSPEATSSLHGLLECRIQRSCRLDDAELHRVLWLAAKRNPNAGTPRVLLANFAFNALGDAPYALCLIGQAIRLQPGDPVHRETLTRLKLASKLPSFPEGDEVRCASITTGRAMG
ncbi:MAG TPA: hypothetical protein VFE72_02215 [Lysobacter sp.]|nr:hypothetical protein [Lysobacter sp.]